MRILHVLDHSLPLQSGYVYRTLGIIEAQRLRGWETLHITSSKQGALATARMAQGLRFFRTPSLTGSIWRLPILRHYGVVLALRKQLLKLARHGHPDLLHAHSPALNGLAALYVGRRLGLPVLYEVRAFWEDAAGDRAAGPLRTGRYWLSRALENYVLRRAAAITTICEGLRKDMIGRGIPPSRITVVPNAVDQSQFGGSICTQPQSSPSTQSVLPLNERCGAGPILAFAGSYYAYEGLDMLISAMPAILRQHAATVLLCAGGGPQQEALQKLVQELDLGAHVRFLGRFPHSEVSHLYAQADVMVYPRLSLRLTELVTPLKPLEAMAHGCLVLASDVGGHRELIDDGRTGTLFRAGDRVHLVQTLMALLAAPERWPALRECARTQVLRERNWQRSVAAYDPVYRRLIR